MAFVGGHNVGDEYLGLDPVLSPWRDTHIKITGVGTVACQIVFMEDWYWATRRVPELDWRPSLPTAANQRVLILPTGPADETQACSLSFMHLINSAKARVWIVSPYFVPDEALCAALQLAATRGVEVRVLLPTKPDHKTVYLAGFSYFEETMQAGVEIYRYDEGFLHQKIILVDDDVAGVGTVNLDNRSLRLNFEITAFVADVGFVRQVDGMLRQDFNKSRKVSVDDYRLRSALFKAGVKAARLLSPIL
jgi:cardiolipin synthase